MKKEALWRMVVCKYFLLVTKEKSLVASILIAKYFFVCAGHQQKVFTEPIHLPLPSTTGYAIICCVFSNISINVYIRENLQMCA